MRVIALGIFLAVSLVLPPRIAEEQPGAKPYRIGLLGTGAGSSTPRITAMNAMLDPRGRRPCIGALSQSTTQRRKQRTRP